MIDIDLINKTNRLNKLKGLPGKIIYITADGKSNMTKEDALRAIHELENDTVVSVQKVGEDKITKVLIKTNKQFEIID